MFGVGFTGTRCGCSKEQLATLTNLLPSLFFRYGFVFIHGDCKGTDREVHDLIRLTNEKTKQPKIIAYPGPGKINRACECDTVEPVLPYLERNKLIVDNSAMLLAVPNGLEILRSGTWATIRYARKVNKPIAIVWPFGTIEWENVK